MKKEILESATITGEAQNAKEGAVIQTNDQIYYLEGIDEWPNEVIGKKILAVGLIIKETFEPQDLKDENGKWIQGSLGDKYIISHPEWRIMN